MSGKRAAAAAPVGVFVLGMHRSGTSILARLLNLLGCALPRDLLGANESNPSGHWESIRAVEINDALLTALDRRWDDVRALPADWLQRPETDAARLHIRAFLDREFAGKPLWLLKDPRLCRLGPVWFEVARDMGMQVRTIVPVRHPLEVAYSLLRRDGIGPGRAQLLWCRHLLEAEQVTRGQQRTLLLLEELLADWRGASLRIAGDLGVEWPNAPEAIAAEFESFLRPALLHSDAEAPGAKIALSAPVADLYAGLKAAPRAQSWQAISDGGAVLDAGEALFSGAVDELAAAATDSDRRAASIDALLSGRIIEGSAALAGQDELARLRYDVAHVLARVDAVSPLGVELVQQLEAERAAIAANAAAQADQAQALGQRIDNNAELVAELVQQLEAERAAIAANAAAQADQAHVLGQRIETNAELVAELVRQIEAQRAFLRDSLQETREQVIPATLADLVRQLEEERAHVAGALEAQREQVASALESQRAQFEELLRGQGDAAQATVFSDRLAWRLNAMADRLEATQHALLASDDQVRALTIGLVEYRTQAEALERSRDEEGARAEGLARGLEEYRAHAEALERRRAVLEAALAAQAAQLEEMRGSTSWRLTAPLRWLRHLFRGDVSAPRAAGGRALRSAYRSLPVGWSTRLRIKREVFRITGPLIRHTDAYRRWQSQDPLAPRPGFAPVPAAPPEPAVVAAPAAAFAAAAASVHVPLEPTPVDMAELRAKLIAFYLPQFHPIPENDVWWGRGFTEWTNVSKAQPQFIGHDQPRLPGELGFYDLRVPDVMARQIELARHYGVHGFCFHYYWFDGRRVLERPVEQFLDDPAFDFPFCLCWANENWTRRWDGHDHDVLLGQVHTPDSDLRFIRDVEPVLRDPRYLRVGGRPLLIVYRPALLPDCAATVERWRNYCRESGLGEILLVMVQFDAEDPRPFGFDAAVEFPPHKLARDLANINDTLPGLNPRFRGYVMDYQAVVKRAREWPQGDFDLIRGVFPGWDNEARKPEQGFMFAHASPDRYQQWLADSVAYARAHPVHGEPLVFVNAWNEWAEGAYLEPDRRHGYAFLQATRNALTGAGEAGQTATTPAAPARGRIAVVAHDAHPHGAQYLSLHLCRELRRSTGMQVEAVLLGDGVLEGEFHQQARVHMLPRGGGTEAGAALARELHAAGVDFAIANTTVCGLFAADLARAGIEVISLVHELPGVIESMALQEHARAIAANASLVVFAGDAVRQGFESFAPLDPARVLIQPQGLYKRNRFQDDAQIAQARLQLRERLGIPAEARIVLCVGYADRRKGVDLFLDAGEILVRQDPNVHMVWVGHLDLELEPALRARVRDAGLEKHVHFTGRDPDTDPWYAGSDVYALTSREDPFPTVIMEAFDVGVPVVAFSGAGGFESLLARAGGKLVSGFDAAAFAEACAQLLRDETVRRSLGQSGRDVLASEFDFEAYVAGLRRRFRPATPKVSVVVPNYNYARYLGERLASVAGQSLPAFELIVLDDASTDDSLAVLERLSASIPFRLVKGERNSGSVFRQWQRGVEAASGDFVWIAEADDLADPGFLAALLPAFADERVVMSYCQSRQIDEKGETLAPDYLDYVADFGAERWRAPFVAGLDEELAHGLAVKNTIPNVSACVFRREALARVLREHGEDIAAYRVAGDWLVYLHLLAQGRIAFRPEALNAHRRHGGSITIGGSQRPHFEEVRRVQQWVQGQHAVDAPTRMQAQRYLEFLVEYLGITPTEA